MRLRPCAIQGIHRSLQTGTLRLLSSSSKAGEQASNKGTAQDSFSASRGSLGDDIRAYTQNLKAGKRSLHDDQLITINEAKVFPRIKTTSLSTKRVVIHDEAAHKHVTLVMVAFRSFADNQLQGWRNAFTGSAGEKGQTYDVTMNESFGAQALSGFIQRWQRGRTDPAFHDYIVAFNSKAREPLESLMISTNRLYGNILLLDQKSRVRFRAAGEPCDQGLKLFLEVTQQLIDER